MSRSIISSLVSMRPCWSCLDAIQASSDASLMAQVDAQHRIKPFHVPHGGITYSKNSILLKPPSHSFHVLSDVRPSILVPSPSRLTRTPSLISSDLVQLELIRWNHRSTKLWPLNLANCSYGYLQTYISTLNTLDNGSSTSSRWYQKPLKSLNHRTFAPSPWGALAQTFIMPCCIKSSTPIYGPKRLSRTFNLAFCKSAQHGNQIWSYEHC